MRRCKRDWRWVCRVDRGWWIAAGLFVFFRRFGGMVLRSVSVLVQARQISRISISVGSNITYQRYVPVSRISIRVRSRMQVQSKFKFKSEGARRGSWVSSLGGASKAMSVNSDVSSISASKRVPVSVWACFAGVLEYGQDWCGQGEDWYHKQKMQKKEKEKEKQSLSVLGAVLYVGARHQESQLELIVTRRTEGCEKKEYCS